MERRQHLTTGMAQLLNMTEWVSYESNYHVIGWLDPRPYFVRSPFDDGSNESNLLTEQCCRPVKCGRSAPRRVAVQVAGFGLGSPAVPPPAILFCLLPFSWQLPFDIEVVGLTPQHVPCFSSALHFLCEVWPTIRMYHDIRNGYRVTAQQYQVAYG